MFIRVAQSSVSFPGSVACPPEMRHHFFFVASGLSGEGCTNEDALMLQMVAINQHPESAALTGNDAV